MALNKLLPSGNARLQIHLFGAFTATLDGKPPVVGKDGMGFRKADQLLALLVFQHPTPITREQANELLRAGQSISEDDGMENGGLSGTESTFRHLDKLIPGFLVKEGTPSKWTLKMDDVWSDALFLEKAIAIGEPSDLEEARQLFDKQLLMNWRDRQWAKDVATKWRGHMLRKAKSRLENGIISDEVKTSLYRLMIAIDPLLNKTYREFMGFLWGNKQHQEAIERYEDYKKSLAKYNSGLSSKRYEQDHKNPSDDIQRLYQEIVNDTVRSPITKPVSTPHNTDVRFAVSPIRSIPVKDWIMQLLWASNGKMLAGAFVDGSISVWEAETGTLMHTFEGHKTNQEPNPLDLLNPVRLAWSPSGNTLASVRQRQGIQFWDCRTGLQSGVIPSRNFFQSVAWAPDGRTIAVGLGKVPHSVQIWDVSTLSLVGEFRDEPEQSPFSEGWETASRFQKVTRACLTMFHRSQIIIAAKVMNAR